MSYIYQLAIEAPPYAQRYTVNRPVLKFPFPFANTAIVSAAQEPLLIEPDFKTPMNYQWTFSVEQQITSTLVAKANYIGSRGTNLTNLYNPNAQPQQIVGDRPFVPATAGVPNSNFTSFRYIGNISDQWYHAGQFVVEKRVTGAGLRFNGSYTWSKNLDTGGGGGTKCAEQVGGTSSFAVYNSRDFGMDKGLSAYHVAHNLIFSSTYELPFGAGHHWGSQWNRLTDSFLGGWVLSGTNTFRSGLPVNITVANSGSGNRSRCLATSANCVERPDLMPAGNNNPVLENWTPDRYFDPTQFVLQPLGYFGNLGRNTLIRPGLWNLNVSLGKSINVGEAKNLEFRSEFFNFFNHPNFGAPSAQIFDSLAARDDNAGRITSTANEMRRIQLSLRLTF
jgi:hypothetical protein